MSNINARTEVRTNFAPPRQFSFLRIPVVLERRGVSRSAHYADIKAGLFPKPVPIGLRAVAHPDYEVDALNAARVAGKSAIEIRALVLNLEAARKVAK
jgi:prophage regulatory protein